MAPAASLIHPEPRQRWREATGRPLLSSRTFAQIPGTRFWPQLDRSCGREGRGEARGYSRQSRPRTRKIISSFQSVFSETFRQCVSTSASEARSSRK